MAGEQTVERDAQSAELDVPPAYTSEFGAHWRSLLAATLGLSSGLALNSYISNSVAPYLLDAFQWSKAEFALTGTLSFLTILCIPLVGRLTDLFGARKVALLGILSLPLTFLLLASMTGDIRIYFAITVSQVVLCSSTTTTVYSRVVAERFTASRGLALAVFAGGPAVVGGVGGPLLTHYIDAVGWRAGYIALASFSAVLGAVAFLLLPAKDRSTAEASRERRHASHDYRSIARTPVFWILLVSALLCSLPHALSMSQLKVMLIEHDVSSVQAAFMVSIFAAGVIVGRLLSGIALDRMSACWVAAIGMGMPCIGLFILAGKTQDIVLVGAEGDILTYLAARYFDIRIYSTVVGLLLATVGCAMTLGAALLSLTLYKTDSFRVFMIIASASALAGGLNFLRLRTVQG